MAFDYKKEYKAYYQPPKKPVLIEIPPMQFIAVRGKGDPNAEGGAYQQALSVLYAVAYTIRMSKKAGWDINGFFEYVVPPLEGLWQQSGSENGELDYSRKNDFSWISMIRLPEFVTEADVRHAIAEATRKKALDCSVAEYFTYHEGLCVQCMHLGPYDSEPETIAQMTQYLAAQGCTEDHAETRLHHEIYLSDPRRNAPEKLKTVIRIPAKRI